jgi:hypothetical protein
MKQKTNNSSGLVGVPVGSTKSSRIQFIGGPSDGHWRRYDSDQRKLPHEVILLTGIPWQTTITGLPARSTGTISLMGAALYEIAHLEKRASYHYVGSISGGCFQRLICEMNSSRQMQ